MNRIIIKLIIVFSLTGCGQNDHPFIQTFKSIENSILKNHRKEHDEEFLIICDTTFNFNEALTEFSIKRFENFLSDREISLLKDCHLVISDDYIDLSKEFTFKGDHFKKIVFEKDYIEYTGIEEISYSDSLVYGIVRYSDICYNERKDRGVLFLVNYCGNLCSYGYIFFIVKNDHKWEIESKYLLWIS